MKKSFLAVRTTGWLALFGAGALIGCSDSSPVTAPFDFDGSPTVTGSGGSGGTSGGTGGAPNDGGETGDGPVDVFIPPGGSVGSMCSGTMPCRTGLSCSASNACEPGGMLPPGASCVINAECAAGNVCNWIGNVRQCGPAGSAPAGASCMTNSDCAKGLRCTLGGFGPKCTPEGTVDLYGACKTSAECFGGLACLAGKCGVPLPGAPPFGLPTWPGEQCDPDDAAAISYFRVPRGTGDKDFYRLPFPNDIRTKNGHPDLTGHPTPGTALLGFDPVDRYLRAIEADNDGFGPYSTVFFRFSKPFDVTKVVDVPDGGPDGGPSQEARYGMDYVDLTSGPDYGKPALNGMFWVLDYGRNAYICPNYFAIRMLPGRTLKPGHTYAVILHDYISVSPTGAPIGQDADFTAMLAPTAPADPALAAAYAVYRPLRDYLTAKAIQTNTVVNATVFTVGHPGNEMANVQKAVQAAPAPAATGWVKCAAGVASPCPDATGDRACGAADPAFDELHALVSLPIFQSGAAPYASPPDGHIDTSAPKVVRTENVCMSLTVPKGATMPASGWPLVLYAHGTGGSFRSHVLEGVANALATTGADNTVPFAVLGIDQVEHGPRRGTSTDTPDNLFYNFGNPGAARDNAMQGAADQMSLARFAASLDIQDTALTGAEVKINPAAILFWGHSQGATEGGISAPYTPELAGVVFSGQGASLIDALLNKTKPVNIAGSLAFALSDMIDPATGKLRGDQFHPVLSLLQMYLDPSDPLNHAADMAPPTSGGHHVFQVYGQNDSYAPPITEVTYAIAAGLAAAKDDPKVTKPDFAPCAGCVTIFPAQIANSGGVVTKNVGGRLTAAVRQYAQPMDADGGVTFDGHFVAYHNPLAQHDVYRFLDDVAKGMIPTVGP
jgi:hypothetical protein